MMTRGLTSALAGLFVVATAAVAVAGPPDGTCKINVLADPGILFSLDEWQTDFCKTTVPLTEIRDGGPPRDGIPPIDSPVFEHVRDADKWLAPREPVIELTVGSVSRAYPLQILIWHEIVNDRIAGTPVAVTFCPLCYTALAFVRPMHSAAVLTFGTTGNLRHSDMVMWDRQTESWWQQFTGEAIVGELAGWKLKQVPSRIVSWKSFKDRHPNAEVLSRETGHQRNYGQNPYVGYDDVSGRPFALFGAPTDPRHAPMARIVGVVADDDRDHVMLTDLQLTGSLMATLGDQRIVYFWAPHVASALDRANIATSKDIGTTAVYVATVADRPLEFKQSEPGRFIDQQTGSTWNASGQAISGPLSGTRLQPLPHIDTFWFAWSIFMP